MKLLYGKKEFSEHLSEYSSFKITPSIGQCPLESFQQLTSHHDQRPQFYQYILFLNVNIWLLRPFDFMNFASRKLNNQINEQNFWIYIIQFCSRCKPVRIMYVLRKICPALYSCKNPFWDSPFYLITEELITELLFNLWITLMHGHTSKWENN